MIEISNVDVYGFETAIRGMRNPLNSWDRSDSKFHCINFCDDDSCQYYDTGCNPIGSTYLGQNDLTLMQKLFLGGAEHRKYLRFIDITMDITAPLYWWKEFDTYKVGTSCNSCSTMHKIHSKEFTIDDFSVERICRPPEYEVMYDDAFSYMLIALNEARRCYLETKNKRYWETMIQLLPSSYNQKRTVQLNYEVAVRIIQQRKGHKLTEWHELVEVLENLPYMKEIMSFRG